MTTQNEIRASESQHWYDRLGKPMYTVIGKNGKERNTTLRDARQLSLVPSVTTILNVAAKPALNVWIQRQVLMAALTLPKKSDESEEEWINRIMADSKEEGKEAANRGTEIHASIQRFYDGEGYGNHMEHVASFHDLLCENYGRHHKWIAEMSFANELGFGGKTDLHSTDGHGIVIDVKTKEFDKDDKVVGYDEHLMQLAAYRVGLRLPHAECANAFVSRSVPGLVVLHKWTQEDLAKGWEMFKNLLQFWQVKNGHK
jgi:hypothetical protein